MSVLTKTEPGRGRWERLGRVAIGQRDMKELSEEDWREHFQEEEEAGEAPRQERTWCGGGVRGGGAGVHPCGGAGRGLEVRVSTLLYLLFMTRDLCLGWGGDGVGI